MKETKDEVIRHIEENREQTIDLLADLVRIPSISRSYPGVDEKDVLGGETRCNERLAREYEALGAEVDLFEAEPGRANLVGLIKGSGQGRSLIFNGHIDTVPPGDFSDWRWNDPYSGKVEDGRLHGLGSCDMKGGLAAQFAAARALKDAGVGLRGDLILESVVGEETMDHEAGVTSTIKRGYRADGAVVSEPSAGSVPLAVAPASPGLLFLKIHCRGVATHPGARYQFVRAGGDGDRAGVNAVEKGVLILEALQDLERQWGFTKKHPVFPPGYFTIHPGVIVGGPPGPLVPFIVSTFCRVEYIIWYPPREKVEDVKEEIVNYVLRASAQDTWLSRNPPRFEWMHHWPPFEIASDHPLTRAMVESHLDAAGGDPKFSQGRHVQGFQAVCDATYFNQNGIPSLVYGPGSGLVAHRRDEFVPLDELFQAAKAYALLALNWCG